MLILYLVCAMQQMVLRALCSLHPQLTQTFRHVVGGRHGGLAHLSTPSRPFVAYSRSLAGQICSGATIIRAAGPRSCSAS